MKISIFAAAVFLLVSVAHAAPPEAGQVMRLNPSVLCDTEEQVKAIVDAFEVGVDAGAAEFFKLSRTQNYKREPVCAITGVRSSVHVDSTKLGQVEFAGLTVWAWIVHIANPAGEGYFLYLETFEEMLKDSI